MGDKVKTYRGALRVTQTGSNGGRGSAGAQTGKNLISENFRILTDVDVITRLGTAKDVMNINGIPVDQIINKSGTVNPKFWQQVLNDVERVKDALADAITKTQLHHDLTDRIDLIDEPITGLVDRMTGAEGNILQNQQDITALESTVNDPTTGVDANASAISTLDSRITTNDGEITANASDITTLQTEMNTVQGDISGNATAIGALDSRVTTNDGEITANATAITALESTVNDPVTGVDANAVAVSVLETTVSNNEGDISANASAITTLQTSVGDNTAAVQTNATSIDGLEAQYTIKLDVNGHVAGIGLASTTNDEGQVTSDIIMLADRFSIGFPAAPWAASVVYAQDQFTKPTTGNNFVYRCTVAGTTGSTEPTWPTTAGNTVVDGTITWECTTPTETIPFIVAMVEGVPQVIMDNAMIASLTAGKITAGVITANGIYLGDETFEMDGFNKRITVKDAQTTPVTRVQLGKLGSNPKDYGIRIKNQFGQEVFSKDGLTPPGAILHVGGGRYAYGVAAQSASYISYNADAARTLDLGTFYSPTYGSSGLKTRVVDTHMDFFLDCTIAGDRGDVTFYVEVRYDGGAWTSIYSASQDCDWRGTIPINVVYTSTSSWSNKIAFRVRTDSNTQSIAGQVKAFNVAGESVETEGNVAGTDGDPTDNGPEFRPQIGVAQSNEGNLIPNGYLITGDNYGWSEFTYAGVVGDVLWPSLPAGDKPPGVGMITALQGNCFSDFYIPVAPDDYYYMEGWFRSSGGDPGQALAGIACYDENKVFIASQEIKIVANTETTLLATANQGATTVHITSASNWIDTGIQYIAFDTQADKSDLPNRTVIAIDSISGTTVTLASPLPQAYGLGTTVREHLRAAAYTYTLLNSEVPAYGEKRTGVISGTNTDYTTVYPDKFHRGTRYVRFFCRPNNAGTATPTNLYIAGLSLSVMKRDEVLRGLPNLPGQIPRWKLDALGLPAPLLDFTITGHNGKHLGNIDDGGGFRRPLDTYIDTNHRVFGIFDSIRGLIRDGDYVGEGTLRSQTGLQSSGKVVSGLNPLTLIADDATFRKVGTGYVDPSHRVKSVYDSVLGAPRSGDYLGEGAKRAQTGLTGTGVVNKNIPGGIKINNRLASDVDTLTGRVADGYSTETAAQTTIARPGGAEYSESASNITGAIKIALPQLWTNTMLRFKVDIFDYSTGSSVSIEVGGYNKISSSEWFNVFAHLLGAAKHAHKVRFGHDGTSACIWIGETTTDWDYPKIVVRDFEAGHSSYAVANWASGWSISRVSAFDTVQVTKNYTLPGGSTEQAGSGTRIGDSRNIGQENSANVGANIVGSSSPLSSSDVGTDVTINIASFSIRYPHGDVAYNSGSITGKSYTTTYTIYFDDPDFSGGSMTYIADQEQSNATAALGRVWLGFVNTVGVGGTGGGTGGGAGCIAPEMYLSESLQAVDAQRGDAISRFDGEAITKGKIQNEPRTIIRPRVRLTTPSGAVIICSVDTPIEQPNGRVVMAAHMFNGHVYTEQEDGSWAWESINAPEYIGEGLVVAFSVGDGSFPAGENPNRRIVTHNKPEF